MTSFILKSRQWLVDEKGNIIMGEGRKEILENIEKTGSLNQTAKVMKMSYKGVWSKIKATENNMKLKLLGLILLVTLFWPSSVVLAQGEEDLSLWAVLSTVVYGIIGIILCILGYLAFDRLARLDLRRELVEDQNIALGIMLAGVFIGIAIVVAAAIT